MNRLTSPIRMRRISLLLLLAAVSKMVPCTISASKGSDRSDLELCALCCIKKPISGISARCGKLNMRKVLDVMLRAG